MGWEQSLLLRETGKPPSRFVKIAGESKAARRIRRGRRKTYSRRLMLFCQEKRAERKAAKEAAK